MGGIAVVFGLVLLGVAAAEWEQELYNAADSGNHEQVQQYIALGNVDINWKNPNQNGNTALIAASSMMYTDIVKMLLDAGAEVNHLNGDGETALIIASEIGIDFDKLLLNARDTMNLLLGAGATVNQENYDGSTPLIKLLLDAGATVDNMNEWGETALYYASRYNNIEVAKLLLDAGAPVDQVMPRGMTALHFAAIWNSTDVVKLLLQYGAKTKKLSDNGDNPADHARNNGNDELAEYIDDYTHAPTSTQGATSTTVSVNHVALLIKVITREVFLTGSLMVVK